jgi:DNA-binding NtrC family response regulator
MARLNGSILVADDNQDVLDSIEMFLKFEYSRVDTVRNPNLIPETLRSYDYDVILLDMNFSAGLNTGNEGFYWLRQILEIDPGAVVVLFTAYGDVDLAVRAMKEGATDFVLKPWDNDKLISTINSAFRLRQSKLEVRNLQDTQKLLRSELDSKFKVIIGSSDAMKKVLQLVNQVAVTDANVLIIGENGTGKELIARELHRLSGRSAKVFISVDLGSISETLFESEIFGHVRGAFTDAKDDRAGRFEAANGGTLFLDEIGNISPASQSKLLAALQNRTVTRVGSNKSVNVDIRLISATNRNIEEMVKTGVFREDLLYRINTIQVAIPPLRERSDDIPELAEHFLKRFAGKYNKHGLRIDPSAELRLKQHTWPGNIRELEHTIEKGVILSRSDRLTTSDLFLRDNVPVDNYRFAQLNLEIIEKEAVSRALRKNGGNLSETARELGVSRPTLYKKMEKYGL